jgi:hypothetical protein
LFENRVLRGVFGHKRGEVTGEWRKLLNNLYSFDLIPIGDIDVLRGGSTPPPEIPKF